MLYDFQPHPDMSGECYLEGTLHTTFPDTKLISIKVTRVVWDGHPSITDDRVGTLVGVPFPGTLSIDWPSRVTQIQELSL